MTSGFQNGDLIIAAGRPSMGKTAFALSIASFAARNGFVVGFFIRNASGAADRAYFVC